MDLDIVAAALAPRLLAYALARTGNLAAAEDVAQDALTALVRHWRQSGPPRSPEAFVFSVAKRRATRARAKRALVSALDAVRHYADPAPRADRAIENRRELASVRSALSRLPRRDREPLLLRAVADLPYDALGEILHISPAAAKMRVSRARERLATLILDQPHDSIAEPTPR